jgi:hypothetical protein
VSSIIRSAIVTTLFMGQIPHVSSSIGTTENYPPSQTHAWAVPEGDPDFS